MGSRFLRAAIPIIFFERSIAVIRPLVSRSQTSDTATPCPQPTSSTRSAGSSARVSTAHTNRSEGLLAMPYALPLPNTGGTSAMSYSAVRQVPLIRVAHRARIQTKGVVAPHHGRDGVARHGTQPRTAALVDVSVVASAAASRICQRRGGPASLAL